MAVMTCFGLAVVIGMGIKVISVLSYDGWRSWITRRELRERQQAQGLASDRKLLNLKETARPFYLTPAGTLDVENKDVQRAHQLVRAQIKLD